MTEKKDNRGGYREGSGRPKGSISGMKTDNTESIRFRCNKKQKSKIVKDSEKNGMTMSKYILSKLGF